MENAVHTYLKRETNLPDDAISDIALRFDALSVRRNQLLEAPGNVCRKIYFVQKGCLRLYEIDQKGEDITAYFALEDSLITSLPSFITQKPSRDFLVAQEASELWGISREDFFAATGRHPSFRDLYNRLIEFAFIHSQMRIYSFLGMDGMDKLRWVMEHEPQLLARVPSKAVASYLGMTNSTLSRLRARLAR